MSPEMFRKLASLGLSHEQMAGVLEIFDEDAGERRAKVKARVDKWRKRLWISSVKWEKLSASVKARDGFACVYCGSAKEPLHCDHIKPLSQGDTNDISNLATACRACNCGKSGRTLAQWRGVAQ